MYHGRELVPGEVNIIAEKKEKWGWILHFFLPRPRHERGLRWSKVFSRYWYDFQLHREIIWETESLSIAQETCSAWRGHFTLSQMRLYELLTSDGFWPGSGGEHLQLCTCGWVHQTPLDSFKPIVTQVALVNISKFQSKTKLDAESQDSTTLKQCT